MKKLIILLLLTSLGISCFSQDSGKNPISKFMKKEIKKNGVDQAIKSCKAWKQHYSLENINTTLYNLVIAQSLHGQEGLIMEERLIDNLHICNYGSTHDKVQEIYNSEKLAVFDLMFTSFILIPPKQVYSLSKLTISFY